MPKVKNFPEKFLCPKKNLHIYMGKLKFEKKLDENSYYLHISEAFRLGRFFLFFISSEEFCYVGKWLYICKKTANMDDILKILNAQKT